MPALDFFNMLEGTWENKLNGGNRPSFGWTVIIQPELGNPKDRDFSVCALQMQETITFRPSGVVRNVGISGDAGFLKGMAYEINIDNACALPCHDGKSRHGEGKAIHQESGHFLIKVSDETGGSPVQGESSDATVIRQAVIPRANAMMSTGRLKPGSLQDVAGGGMDDFYSSKPEISDSELQSKLDAALDAVQGTVNSRGGPDLQKPLEWLNNVLANEGWEATGVDWVFNFSDVEELLKMHSAHRVNNPIGVGPLFSDFWIGTREDQNSKEEITVLQYAQKVNLEFGGVSWPHVALNTLIKQTG